LSLMTSGVLKKITKQGRESQSYLWGSKQGGNG
jgi:hypothetical protein